MRHKTAAISTKLGHLCDKSTLKERLIQLEQYQHYLREFNAYEKDIFCSDHIHSFL